MSVVVLIIFLSFNFFPLDAGTAAVYWTPNGSRNGPMK